MAADIRLYTGLVDHFKTMELDALLGDRADRGFRSLVTLWLWAAQNRPDGSLRGMTAAHIEAVARWDLTRPGAFVKALLEVGFLEGEEGRYSVHDWAEHQLWVLTQDARHEQAKKAAEARWKKTARKTEADALREQRLEKARGKGTHSEDELRELLRICGRVCVQCKQDRKLQWDHIHSIYNEDDPLASDAIGNLQPLCESCNKAKGSATRDYRPPNWERLLRATVPSAAGVEQEDARSNARSIASSNAPNPTKEAKKPTATYAPPQPQAAEGDSAVLAELNKQIDTLQQQRLAARGLAPTPARAGPAAGKIQRTVVTLQGGRAF